MLRSFVRYQRSCATGIYGLKGGATINKISFVSAAKKYRQGILLCLIIAFPCWLSVQKITALQVIGAPIIAIVLGMLLNQMFKKHLTTDESIFKPGIKFTSKKVLQFAVVLLGFNLNLVTVGQVGLHSLPIIVCTIATSLVTAYIMMKALDMPSEIATLVGVGSSICGGSAIAATAPVINASDEDIAQAISIVFFFNVIAALIFPTLGGMLGLTNEGFGLFAGTAINDTSSVTAAASVWDTLYNTNGSVLEYATIVKLTRTLAIIPITLFLSLYVSWRSQKKGIGSGGKFSLKKSFPMFIAYFVLASLLTTVIYAVCSGSVLGVADNIFSFLRQCSKFFIVMAMTAIGLNTDIVKLIKTGAKPLLLGFSCWTGITCVSLLMQHLLGMW